VPRTLHYTEEAIADLDRILHWQTQPGSGPAAIRRLRAIRTAIQRLKQNPCLHPIGEHPNLRELSCEGHRVMYEVVPDTGRSETAGNVVVLRVFGPGQERDVSEPVRDIKRSI
jgi:plasmid stabilization system protein ParE